MVRQRQRPLASDTAVITFVGGQLTASHRALARLTFVCKQNTACDRNFVSDSSHYYHSLSIWLQCKWYQRLHNGAESVHASHLHPHPPSFPPNPSVTSKPLTKDPASFIECVWLSYLTLTALFCDNCPPSSSSYAMSSPFRW